MIPVAFRRLALFIYCFHLNQLADYDDWATCAERSDSEIMLHGWLLLWAPNAILMSLCSDSLRWVLDGRVAHVRV